MSVYSERRFGRFSIDHTVLQDMPAEKLARVFEGLVVVRAESDYAKDAIEYTAWCADFDPVPRGWVVPFYSLTIHESEDSGQLARTWSDHG